MTRSLVPIPDPRRSPGRGLLSDVNAYYHNIRDIQGKNRSTGTPHTNKNHKANKDHLPRDKAPEKPIQTRQCNSFPWRSGEYTLNRQEALLQRSKFSVEFFRHILFNGTKSHQELAVLSFQGAINSGKALMILTDFILFFFQLLQLINDSGFQGAEETQLCY